MSAWLLPSSPLSGDALAFRLGWADRWQGCNPHYGDCPPEGTVYDHRHAHPDFRNPLSSTEAFDASVEFHAAVIGRLARGRPVTLMTFDFEWEWEGQRGREISALDGLLQRDLLASVVQEPEDDDGSVTHAFISHIAVDDPRLVGVWSKTAAGEAPVMVVGPEMAWLARPHEECVAVHSFDGADLEVLRDTERETWDRWGVAQDRVALLDLAQVAAYFADRRQVWLRDGVRVVTGPQYRVWRDGQFDHIAEELPADLSQTDWFLVVLESQTAEAQVIVHDSGTCTVHMDTGTPDVESETFFEHPQHAGSLDLDGVVEVLERVAVYLARKPRL